MAIRGLGLVTTFLGLPPFKPFERAASACPAPLTREFALRQGDGGNDKAMKLMVTIQ